MTPDLRARCEELAESIGAEAADAVPILMRFYHDGYRAGLAEAAKLCDAYAEEHWRDPNLFLEGQGAGAEGCATKIRQRATELKKEPAL